MTILFVPNRSAAKILPQSCMDLVKPDPALTQAKPEPHVYRCRKCRRVVAAKSNIITHQRADVVVAVATAAAAASNHDDDNETAAVADVIGAANLLSVSDHSDSEGVVDNRQVAVEAINKGRTPPPPPPANNCDPSQPCREIVFVEPMAWMDGVLREAQGKLHCPKCRTKLGSFSWTMGCRCPCGAQQSPAFYLVPARVELSRSVQNVEMSL